MKKPARQPRKIEVVEDVPVATTSAATKKAKKAATPVVVDQPAAQPEQNATVVKSAAKKGKTKATTQSERKHEQPSTVAKVEGKLTGKLSAIDAASKVLETSGPLNCKELIEAMAEQGLWTSPGGKTPRHALLGHPSRDYNQG